MFKSLDLKIYFYQKYRFVPSKDIRKKVQWHILVWHLEMWESTIRFIVEWENAQQLLNSQHFPNIP